MKITPTWMKYMRAFIVVFFLFIIGLNGYMGDQVSGSFALLTLIGLTILWVVEDIKAILVQAFTPVEEPDLEETTETKGE